MRDEDPSGARDPRELAVRSLVRAHEVHRDVYRCPRVFALEMQRLWARAWLFVGHESQVPTPGDLVALQLAGQPVLMLRRGPGGREPLAVQVGETQFALRLLEAECIEVRV